MTPVEAAQIAAMVANAPCNAGAAWTLETQELFARMIEDLPAAESRQAARGWLLSATTRPSIAEFRAAVRRELESAGEISGELDADQAWGVVVAAFASVGRYRAFPADHATVKRVVDRMGWETLCDSTNPEADRAHFLRLYAAEVDRVRAARHQAPGLSLPADARRLESTAIPRARVEVR